MLKIYYYLTPVFLLLDLATDWNVRTAALDGTTMRWYYYAFCVLCAVLIMRYPRWGTGVAAVESVFNFTLLVLSIMLPVMGLAEATHQGQAVALLSPARLINFLLTGTILIVIFQTSLSQLGKR